tara:strand:- start:1400 stop:1600 length:201 start_codon:yes stop_codon:yes gene_type:complete
MQEELIELQSQLAFQEQTITELNEALISQQQQLDRLQKQLAMLMDRLKEVEGAAPDAGQDEKPPHY